MERERIQRLAIDSAAGELNEDAEVLFRAYLADHPEASDWALDMTGIYELTQAAIDASTKGADVTARIPVVDKKDILPVNWRPIARWAAVLAICLFAGFMAGRWGARGKSEPIAVAKVAEQPRAVVKAADLKAKYTDTFWGQKVLASLEPRPSDSQMDHPRQDGIWNRYGKYIEGKRYE